MNSSTGVAAHEAANRLQVSPWGATLLELVVTAALLAIGAAGFFHLYSIGIKAGQHAARLATAVGVAQAQLEELISNPTILLAREVSSETTPATGYQVISKATRAAEGLQHATATVRWVWRGQPRETTVTTLIPNSSPP